MKPNILWRETEIYTLEDPLSPLSRSDDEALNRAAKCLLNGGLAVFPTETVYGLGGLATDPAAAEAIYRAKGRPSDNPLIIHIASPEDAEPYAVTNETYYRLAKAFMPGPLTLILPKKDTVPFSVTGGLPTVAVRCPAHPTARRLIEKTQLPIAAPSANLSGKPSPTRPEHVKNDLYGRVDIILSGGECEIGLESTIVLLDGDRATLLRPGGITYDALLCVLPALTVAPAVAEALKENERPLSPGMKYKHYAPDAPLVLLSGSDAEILAFFRKAQAKENCVILAYTEELPFLSPNGVLSVGDKNDLETQGKRLFAALREADALSPDTVYAHLPKKEGLGLALYNRMLRAAAHTVKEL